MKNHLKKFISVNLASFLFLFANCYSHAAMPEIQQYGTTQFIGGGIGVDECKAMQSEACNWPLHLMFSEVLKGTTFGSWIADVNIKITDKSGDSVLSIISEGPLVLVKLPPGTYILTASYLDKVTTRSITIQEGHSTTVSVSWVE
jgi:hypothetical protein